MRMPFNSTSTRAKSPTPFSVLLPKVGAFNFTMGTYFLYANPFFKLSNFGQIIGALWVARTSYSFWQYGFHNTLKKLGKMLRIVVLPIGLLFSLVRGSEGDWSILQNIVSMILLGVIIAIVIRLFQAIRFRKQN